MSRNTVIAGIIQGTSARKWDILHYSIGEHRHKKSPSIFNNLQMCCFPPMHQIHTADKSLQKAVRTAGKAELPEGELVGHSIGCAGTWCPLLGTTERSLFSQFRAWPWKWGLLNTLNWFLRWIKDTGQSEKKFTHFPEKYSAVQLH